MCQRVLQTIRYKKRLSASVLGEGWWWEEVREGVTWTCIVTVMIASFLALLHQVLCSLWGLEGPRESWKQREAGHAFLSAVRKVEHLTLYSEVA